ncbi:MAG: DNA repair protein RadA [Candidatus Omnitrophota bacterium]|jgi:DNA repair protein RadA/Sms|nr:MAG: DNA repair protein RadA [Candidatus Omnitrophota bacterium]
MYACTSCGHQQSKWFGRCPQCNEWNTAAEETVRPATIRDQAVRSTAARREEPLSLPDIAISDAARYSCGITEVNRVLGGGILPGAAILLGGEPGIGKSTLLLQVADKIAQEYGRVLYLSGEESPAQIKLRAQRLQACSAELFIKPETLVDEMIAWIRSLHPYLAIVDSIQTTVWSELGSAPGSVGQVRDCAALLIRLAKETDTPIILVGHVTKEGNIAGPRILEHLVDVVLYFEGDRHQNYRLLRGAKNRFGSTYEIGIFEMTSAGLQEVPNPAGAFAGAGGRRPAGSVVTVTLEGNRPLLIEVQALVAPFHGYGFPRRTVTGVDGNRLAMILAVLEKRLHLPLGARDIFVNVTGGISIDEPAGDLGIATAILSSFFDIPLPPQYILFGEIGLSGEVRAVRGSEQRLAEARQLGYHHGVIPEGNARELIRQGIPVETIIQARSVEEVKTTLFEP